MGNMRPTTAGAMNRKCLILGRRSYLKHGLRWAPALSTARHSGHYRQATAFSTMERVAGQSFVDSISKSEPDRPGMEMESYEATLMVQCPDRRGVVAALGQLLYGYNCNIVESDQFTDRTTADGPTFFQRIVFDYSDASVGPGNTSVLEGAIDELAGRYNMQWDISYSCHRPQVAVLVSRMDHCLYDLLIRHRNGELKCDIPIIISNHPDLHGIAEMFGITYRHLPMEKGKKVEQEAQINALIEKHNVDLVVLARYMQILSPEFCSKHWKKTINIHHSFLPAFEGARPYHRAHERGVKVIGATAHYATSDLDCGPIIEQDITRISHRDSPSDMIRKGKDLERLVLARAVRWHLQKRVMVHGNKTVVFED